MLSVVHISRKDLLHNFHVFRSYLSPKTKICCVIKANAYGHGQNEAASILEPFADYFAVDHLEELKSLRTITIKETVVLGYVAQDELIEAVQLNGILGIYDEERIRLLDSIAKSHKVTPRVHIKIDAGLGRQGVLVSELESFIRMLSRYPSVKVEGVYSHFSNIDEIDDLSHTKNQEALFAQACRIFEQYGYKNLITHISSTGGILVCEKHEEKHMLARLGIGLYGMWPSAKVQKKFEADGIRLKPVLAWLTKVAQVKTVPERYPIGYNLTYITTKPTKVAVIPQGYSDGYDRKLSNQGEVLIRGIRCKVLGRIAMNMFVVDVSHLNIVKVEDEVVFLGKQGTETITAEEIAEKVGTINYEITTRLSPLLPRIVNE